LQRPLLPELIADEIQRYNTTEAAEVTATIRSEAGLQNALGDYVRIYRSVLEEQQPATADVDWHPATIPLEIDDQALLRLRFLTVPPSVAPRRHFTFEVSLFNGSQVPLATAAPWPSLLMYRWLNASNGSIAVEHGFRSIMQPPAWPGGESVYSMRAIAPNEPGDYVLRVTIIQEGWRWLDALQPAVCVDTPVTIAGELSVNEVSHATL
jgi:hypothetical protein